MFPTRILLATDGSEEAAWAARMATALAEKTGSGLHLVYVEPLPHPYSLSEAAIHYPEAHDEVRETARREAREKLEAAAEKVRGLGEVAGSHARVGRADAEIPHLAEDIGAGLIVVGSRGSADPSGRPPRRHAPRGGGGRRGSCPGSRTLRRPSRAPTRS